MKNIVRKLALLSTPLVLFSFAQAGGTDVLMLNSTLTGGAGSLEAQAVSALGLNPVILSDAAWAALTAGDFSDARGIVLGDATCGGSAAAAEANALLWGPLIDGNIILVGTDPVYHQGQGGDELVVSGIEFALDVDGKTGAYICLSCYYHGTPPATPVPLLDGIGSFTLKGVGCFNDVHIVASHPAIDPLTDASLSNWSCSVHEAFDSWPEVGPDAFLVLAIAENAGGRFNAADGTVGTPYILARGEDLTVISDIDLNPVNTLGIPVGVVKKLTATVIEDGVPISGALVTFNVIAGPCVGDMDTDTTDINGEASFSYTCNTAGIDTVVASYTDSGGFLQTSNQAFCEWVSECFLVVGNGAGNALFTPSYHTLTTQVDQVEAYYPVLLNSIPTFVIPDRGTPTFGGGQLFGHVGAVQSSYSTYAVQVIMYNQVVFPDQPEHHTYGLKVYVDGYGNVVTLPYGSGSMSIWAQLGTNGHGQRTIKFPFTMPQ
jgi:hypothetical protein